MKWKPSRFEHLPVIMAQVNQELLSNDGAVFLTVSFFCAGHFRQQPRRTTNLEQRSATASSNLVVEVRFVPAKRADALEMLEVHRACAPMDPTTNHWKADTSSCPNFVEKFWRIAMLPSPLFLQDLFLMLSPLMCSKS